MKNVTMKIDGKKLLIEVDLSAGGEASKSGKSLVIASTEGNVSVPGAAQVKIGLNIYKPIGA